MSSFAVHLEACIRKLKDCLIDFVVALLLYQLLIRFVWCFYIHIVHSLCCVIHKTNFLLSELLYLNNNSN